MNKTLDLINELKKKLKNTSFDFTKETDIETFINTYDLLIRKLLINHKEFTYHLKNKSFCKLEKINNKDYELSVQYSPTEFIKTNIPILSKEDYLLLIRKDYQVLLYQFKNDINNPQNGYYVEIVCLDNTITGEERKESTKYLAYDTLFKHFTEYYQIKNKTQLLKHFEKYCG